MKIEKNFGLSPIVMAFIIGLIVAASYTVLFYLMEQEEEEAAEKGDKSYAEALHQSGRTQRAETRHERETGETDRLRDGE